MFTTEYFEYYSVNSNVLGFTHVLHDIKKDEWFLIHASSRKLLLKKNEIGNLVANVMFLV